MWRATRTWAPPARLPPEPGRRGNLWAAVAVPAVGSAAGGRVLETESELDAPSQAEAVVAQ